MLFETKNQISCLQYFFSITGNKAIFSVGSQLSKDLEFLT